MTAAPQPRTLTFGLPRTHLIWLAFVLIQVLDGILTYQGILRFGSAAEGNPLVSWYAATFGPVVGLAGAKLFAVACGLILYLTARYREVAVLTLVYLAFAVVPWAALLHA